MLNHVVQYTRGGGVRLLCWPMTHDYDLTDGRSSWRLKTSPSHQRFFSERAGARAPRTHLRPHTGTPCTRICSLSVTLLLGLHTQGLQILLQRPIEPRAVAFRLILDTLRSSVTVGNSSRAFRREHAIAPTGISSSAARLKTSPCPRNHVP